MSTDTDNTTWSQSAKTQEQQEISKLVSERRTMDSDCRISADNLQKC